MTDNAQNTNDSNESADPGSCCGDFSQMAAKMKDMCGGEGDFVSGCDCAGMMKKMFGRKAEQKTEG